MTISIQNQDTILFEQSLFGLVDIDFTQVITREGEFYTTFTFNNLSESEEMVITQVSEDF